MHDFEQNTNATIGSGEIKTGTILNLDSNNNLIGVANGTTYEGDINRNIQTAQVETKHLEVDPIHIKETFEFGRNSTSSQMKADGKTSAERPTIWNDLASDDKSKSLTSSVASGLLTNAAITLEELAYQVNPLRGFGNIIDGISTDLRNIRTELGIKTQTLNVGQDREFLTIDKDGKVLNRFTLADYLQNPSLAANKLFSNGIMNNQTEAISNAQSQLKSTDESGRVTVLFDPTAAPDKSVSQDFWGNVGGLMSDLGEVSVNYLGANVLGGWIQTKGQATDQQFINAVTENAKANGTEITLAGHSGGGLRNYSILANSAQGQYLDSNGNSVLRVQYSGTPANYYDLVQAANNAGVGEVQKQNNSGDTVGNVLGANGGVIEGAWSGINTISLFEIFGLKSPHSNYECILSNCYSGQTMIPIEKPNFQ